MNKDHQNKLCTIFNLGSVDEEVTKVLGGRADHLMWHVVTDKGNYAIKQLGDSIDLNNEKQSIRKELTESIAEKFSNAGIQAIFALKGNGKYLTIIDNTGYLIYPWIEAYSLGLNEVSETHALKIAEATAKIHCINLQIPELNISTPETFTFNDIKEEINKTVSSKCAFANDLKNFQTEILSMNDEFVASVSMLLENCVVSHGDIHQQNILWDKSDNPIFIDWEAVKKMNTTREIIRTCLAWSGLGSDKFSLSIYQQMLQAYKKAGGTIKDKYVRPSLYGTFGNMLFWMIYNIESACYCNNKEDKDIATKECQFALNSIIRLNKTMPKLLTVTANK